MVCTPSVFGVGSSADVCLFLLYVFRVDPILLRASLLVCCKSNKIIRKANLAGGFVSRALGELLNAHGVLLELARSLVKYDVLKSKAGLAE